MTGVRVAWLAECDDRNERNERMLGLIDCKHSAPLTPN